MLRQRAFAWAAAVLVLSGLPAYGQTLNARRMAMGGVMLAGGGEGANVAYRAVPKPVQSVRSLPLPIGLIPILQDPPVTDTNDPRFNGYELANLLYDIPWNYPLVKPAVPGSDITIAVSRGSLAVDLGDVRKLFPEDHTRLGAVANLPLFTLGVKRFFVSLDPLVHYENDMSLNPALHGALANGDAFTPDTRYEAYDKARAQAAAGLALGWAAPVMSSGDPQHGGSGLYVGARAKVLRGLAYGDADNTVSFTTRDTLFGTDPVDVGYHALLRDAGPADGGMGYGLDLGAVAVVGGVELGLGVNDIATRIDWKVRETLVVSDSTGDYKQTTLAEGKAFTSDVPVTVTASAATRLGAVLVAADVVRGAIATVAHAGAELWVGAVALRAGAAYDANQMVQGTGGVGVRLGRFGVDAAVASHSRDITRERGVDLGVGLSLYPRQEATR